MQKILFATIVLISGIQANEKVRYDHYKVYTVLPATTEHLHMLRELQQKNVYNFWNEVKNVGLPVDIMVPPDLSSDFDNVALSNKIQTSVLINNVQEKIEILERTRRSTSSTMNWNYYHNEIEIYAFLKDLSEQYPKQVELLNIGKTYEQRDIIGIHVSFSTESSKDKKSIFIEGGMHAREWISPATVTFILNEILTSSNRTIRNLAHHFDWYFFPVVNPDGYAYTFTNDRLWRNTRKPHGCPFQVGADPNRNWDIHWLETGSSDHPCSVVYAGSFPFSENCTRVLSNFISTIGHKLLGYIAFHSYGQALIIPYGYTAKHLDNYDELKSIGNKAVQSLASRYGTNYEIGNAAKILYPVAGSSMDWVKKRFNTKIVYTFELRDRGRHGFLLPTKEIIPTALETLDALITVLEEAIKVRN